MITVAVNGVNYNIPEPGDSNWGLLLQDFFQAVASYKLNITDIVNNLTSGGTAVPLSAEQGKTLQSTKMNKKATTGVENNIVLYDDEGDAKDSTVAIADVLQHSDVVNNLTSGGTTVPLSAEQGKTLQDTKMDILSGTGVTDEILVGDANGNAQSSGWTVAEIQRLPVEIVLINGTPAMYKNKCYVASAPGGITFQTDSDFSWGDRVMIVGHTGTWTINLNGHTAYIDGNIYVGYLQSSQVYDSMEMVWLSSTAFRVIWHTAGVTGGDA